LGIDLILAAVVAFFKLSSTDAKLEGMIQWKFEWLFLGNKTISLGLGLDNLAAVIEPVLMLVIGVAVGGVALAVIMPIYSLVGQI
jgi:hypothetical protein